jgi:hypothetical protein
LSVLRYTKKANQTTATFKKYKDPRIGKSGINYKAYPPVVNMYSPAELLMLVAFLLFWKELITYVLIPILICQI